MMSNISLNKIHYYNCIGLLHNILTKSEELNSFKNQDRIKPVQMVMEETYDTRINFLSKKPVSALSDKEGLDLFFNHFSIEENKTTVLMCLRYLRQDLLDYLVEKYPQNMQQIAQKDNYKIISAIVDMDENKDFVNYLNWALNHGFNINDKREILNADNVLWCYLDKKTKEKLSDSDKEEIANRTEFLIENGLNLSEEHSKDNGILHYALLLNNKKLNSILLKENVYFNSKECIKYLNNLIYSAWVNIQKSIVGQPSESEEVILSKIDTFLKFLPKASDDVKKEILQYAQGQPKSIEFAGGNWKYLSLNIEKALLQQENIKKKKQMVL